MKDSETAWIATRDKTFLAINAVYAKLDGTMYHPMLIQSKTEVVRHRVQELKGLLQGQP